MRLTAKTDKGKVRSENQDDYRASLQGGTSAWVAVCDGMGGADGGTTASNIAASCVEDRCTGVKLEECSFAQLVTLARELVEQANTQVYQTAQQEPALFGMGTTMVTALVSGRLCCIAAVGDSRAYLYRDGSMQQITHDHSMVQDLVDKGVITQQQAETHPQKNVITRAVGIQSQVEADLFQVELRSQDILLLCTDGLTNALSVDAIEGILSSAAFYDSAASLIDQVLARDDQDNATVVLLAVD